MSNRFKTVMGKIMERFNAINGEGTLKRIILIAISGLMF